MGFCTKCGRQRTGATPFCAGCGARFDDGDDAPVVAEPQADPVPAEQTAAEPTPAVETIVQPAEPDDDAPDSAPSRAELPEVEPTRWDTTRWYKPDPSPPPSPPSAVPVPSGPSHGQPAYGPPSYGSPSHGQSGYGPGSSRQGGYGYGPASYAQGPAGPGPAGPGPAGQPPYQPPPHVYGTRGTSPLRRGQTAILIALLIVVLLAVGGGAYALVSRYADHKTAASPSGPATSPAPGRPTAAATTPESSSSATGPTSPTASPPASPSPKVSVAPGLTSNPAEPAIVAFLDRYFTAINSHDYAAFSSLLDAKEQSVNTPSTFDTGYGTTRDSAEALTRITSTGGGNEAATVSFTSHQNPAQSASKTACTSWTITLYLQPNGASYLIGPAPAGYHASYEAC